VAPAGLFAVSYGAGVAGMAAPGLVAPLAGAGVGATSPPEHDGQGTVVVVARASGGVLVGYVRVT